MINFNEHSAVLLHLPDIIKDIKEIERKINYYARRNGDAYIEFKFCGEGESDSVVRIDNDILVDALSIHRRRLIDKLREVGIDYEGDVKAT